MSIFLQYIRRRRLTDLTFSFSLPYLGTIPETVTLLLQSFDIDLASSTISSAIFCGSESSFISLVPQCKMIFFGFCSVVGFTCHFIWLVVAPRKDFTTTLFESSVSSQPFTSLIMESSRINATSPDFLIYLSSPFYYWFSCSYCYSFLINLYSVYQAFCHCWVLPCFRVMMLPLFWWTIVLVRLWSRRAVENQKHSL